MDAKGNLSYGEWKAMLKEQGGKWNVRNLSNRHWVYEGGFDTETEAAIWLSHYLTLLPPDRDQYEVRRMGATYNTANKP